MRLTDPVFDKGPGFRVEYVAFDSFGVKSMCTRVRTPDVAIAIDPAASAEAHSFPLPEDRRQALETEYLAACRRAAASCQVIVLSHYHLDHFYDTRNTEMYAGKTLLAKALNDLPPNQVQRAERFFRSLSGLVREVVWADGRKFRFKGTEISFSSPVWHGRENAEPGTVIMTTIKHGREKVLVSSDVCGPLETATTDLVCASRAGTVVLDGCPTTHLGQFATDADLVLSIINVCRVLEMKGLKTLVLDHHSCRDYRFPAFYRLCYEKAQKLGRNFGSAAELLGRAPAAVQGLADYGPTRWRKWAPLGADECRKVLEQAIARSEIDPSWLDSFRRWVAT